MSAFSAIAEYQAQNKTVVVTSSSKQNEVKRQPSAASVTRARVGEDINNSEPQFREEVVSAETTNDGEPPVLIETLSSSLKEGTLEVHKAAERMGFISNLARGKVSLGIYVDFLECMVAVYSALENALDTIKDSNEFVKSLEHNKFERLDALIADVQFLCSQDEAKDEDNIAEIALSPATQLYVDRINKLAREDPDLLVPHAYVRYMGDLSGGQILSRSIARAYDLNKDTKEGIQFYVFDGNAKVMKNDFRSALDAMELSSERIEEFVDEAKVAFALNALIFEEMAVKSGLSTTTPTCGNLDLFLQMVGAVEPTHMDAACNKGKCPFAHLWSANPTQAESAVPDRVASEDDTDEGSNGDEGSNVAARARIPKALRLFDLVFGKDHPMLKQDGAAKEDTNVPKCPMPKGVDAAKAIAVAVFATSALYIVHNF